MSRFISVVDDSNSQKLEFVLIDGRKFDLELLYKEQQLAWLMSITYNGNQYNNIRVSTSGNILHQWRNILRFGISCVVEANEEPLLQDDFKSRRAKLYVLDSDEVIEYTRLISGQVSA